MFPYSPSLQYAPHTLYYHSPVSTQASIHKTDTDDCVQHSLDYYHHIAIIVHAYPD